MSNLSALLLQLPSALVATTIALSLVLLPGLAILQCFQALRRIDFLTRLFIAPGISVALYVLLFSFCYRLGIPLGPATPWLIGVIALLLLLIEREGNRFQPAFTRARIRAWVRRFQALPSFDKAGAGLLAITCALVLGISLSLAQGLVGPPGSDSIHHTLIVQLMLDHGGLFSSWQPYDDTSTFTYHIGFHSIATMYAWMRGARAEFATLITGQVVSALAALGVIALVRRWTHSLWASLFAAGVAGLVSIYPMSFINWGRYTHPTGLLGLYTGLVLLDAYLTSPARKGNHAYLVVLPLVIAGIALSHYKIAITFAALAIPLTLTHWVRRLLSQRRFTHQAFIATVGRATTVAGLAVLLFAVRGIEVLQGPNGMRLTNFVSRTPTETDIEQVSAYVDTRVSSDPIAFSQTGLSEDELVIWWLAVAGLAVIVIEKRSAVWLPVGALVCWFLMHPNYLGIRRIALLDPGHLRLSVFILLAVLSALAFDTLAQAISKRLPSYRWATMFACAILVITSFSRLPIVYPGNVYLATDDIQLMDWMRQNLPPGQHVMGLGFVWSTGKFAMGVDGAIWLPYYTRQHTNLANLGSVLEKDPIADEHRLENALLTAAMYQRDMSTPESAQWLEQNGYHYFYLGAKTMDSYSDQDKVATKQLLANPALEVVHQASGARLLAVKKGS